MQQKEGKSSWQIKHAHNLCCGCGLLGWQTGLHILFFFLCKLTLSIAGLGLQKMPFLGGCLYAGYTSPGKCLNTCLENVPQTGDTTRLSHQDSWSGDLLLHAASHCWNTGHCTSGGGRDQGLKTGCNFKERYQKKVFFLCQQPGMLNIVCMQAKAGSFPPNMPCSSWQTANQQTGWWVSELVPEWGKNCDLADSGGRSARSHFFASRYHSAG